MSESNIQRMMGHYQKTWGLHEGISTVHSVGNLKTKIRKEIIDCNSLRKMESMGPYRDKFLIKYVCVPSRSKCTYVERMPNSKFIKNDTIFKSPSDKYHSNF